MAHRAVSRAGQSVIDLGFAEILALSERCFCATLGVRFSIGTVRLQVRVRKQGGMTMFRKLTIALIATAALSIAVFAPTSASAWQYSGWHRGGGGYRGWGYGDGYRRVSYGGGYRGWGYGGGYRGWGYGGGYWGGYGGGGYGGGGYGGGYSGVGYGPWGYGGDWCPY